MEKSWGQCLTQTEERVGRPGIQKLSRAPCECRGEAGRVQVKEVGFLSSAVKSPRNTEPGVARWEVCLGRGWESP